jgi:tRNA threonylcarbamoyladenosine modification (KEOPS) complex  Pcc1 subunit
MKARLKIACKNAQKVLKVLEPESEGDSFKVRLSTEKEKLVIEIEAERLTLLQAGINSYLRLLKTIL